MSIKRQKLEDTHEDPLAMLCSQASPAHQAKPPEVALHEELTSQHQDIASLSGPVLPIILAPTHSPTALASASRTRVRSDATVEAPAAPASAAQPPAAVQSATSATPAAKPRPRVKASEKKSVKAPEWPAAKPEPELDQLTMRRRATAAFWKDMASVVPNDWDHRAEHDSEHEKDVDIARFPGETVLMKDKGWVLFNDALGSTCVGTLFMTSYQLFFRPQRKGGMDPGVTVNHVAVPLSVIASIEVKKFRQTRWRRERGEQSLYFLFLYCKDLRTLRFGFNNPARVQQARDVLHNFVFPPELKFLFCFSYHARLKKLHKLTLIPEDVDGWCVYPPIDGPLREFTRLEIPDANFRLTRVNESFGLCSSYPQVLCVPRSDLISDEALFAVAKFRSRGRIPVLVWRHPRTGGTIWRSSQPRVGMVNQSFCEEDERLLRVVNQLDGSGRQALNIFDCRPKVNAYGNKLAGKGFERADRYPTCSLKFMDIANIHVMRNSLKKLQDACARYAREDSSFFAQVDASGWLPHIRMVLRATLLTVCALDIDGASCLSHCSDGWDRTSQVVALSELCLDPYYRSIRGFAVLVEKEWLSFGHKFHQRLGHADANTQDDQRSPIFLQFLDCVWQLTVQFPTAFEFNSSFLVELMHHVFSCRFGTFLFNTLHERLAKRLPERTVSVWTYMQASPAALAGKFKNPFYHVPEGPPRVLFPTFSPKKLRLWADYYLQWIPYEARPTKEQLRRHRRRVSAVATTTPTPVGAEVRVFASFESATTKLERLMRAEMKARRRAEQRARDAEGLVAALRSDLAALKGTKEGEEEEDEKVPAEPMEEEKEEEAEETVESETEVLGDEPEEEGGPELALTHAPDEEEQALREAEVVPQFFPISTETAEPAAADETANTGADLVAEEGSPEEELLKLLDEVEG